MPPTKAEILANLQRELLPLQGYKSSLNRQGNIELGPINDAFPQAIFPTGAIHEFIISKTENTAASFGFVSALAGKLAHRSGVTIWISRKRTLFPPALARFGLEADQVIFIDLATELDCFWAMEEALKCQGLSAVICETQNLGFTATRRFQLAVEQSSVTGFVVRHTPRSLTNNACIARWRIGSLSSQPENGMPGLGFPRWNVELLKVRNGKPGSWQIEFIGGEFRPVVKEQPGELISQPRVQPIGSPGLRTAQRQAG